MKYLLTDGNVIIATQDFIAENHPDAELVEELDTEEPVTQSTTLTRLAFRNRFTGAEKTAIELAMMDDSSATLEQRQQAAMLRAFDKDMESAEEIDLSFPQLIEGVRALERFGLIAEGRADEMLSLTPEQEGGIDAE